MIIELDAHQLGGSTDAETPSGLGGGGGASAIAAGATFSCALGRDGRVRCSGALAEPAPDGELPPDPSTHDVLAPEDYATVLHELGFSEQDVILRVYDHLLPSTDAVVDWIRGTNLRRFLNRMVPDLHEPYVDAVRRAVVAELGDQRPFFFTFRRILLWGRRA